MVKTRAVFNEPSASVSSVLDDLARESTRTDIAVAFFSDDASVTKWADSGCQVNLVIALAYPTSPDALRAVRSKKSVRIRFYDSDFHAKCYLFYRGAELVAAVVGSSNLTQAGLSSNAEANVVLYDSEYLTPLRDWFSRTWGGAFDLQPDDLRNYTEHYRARREPDRFHSRASSLHRHRTANVRPCKEARDYRSFWGVVNHVRDLVEGEARRNWPQVPLYLVVDHFWHFIKVGARKSWWDTSVLPRMRKDERFRDEHVRVLFSQFAHWDKEGEEWVDKMKETSEFMQRVLGRDSVRRLSSRDAAKVYRETHAGGARERYHGSEAFVKENGIESIRRSLEHLLWSPEDVERRIHDLVHYGSPLKLAQVKESIVQELLGWVRPEELPLRNDKADDAIEMLGYSFR